jgi:hypothetical protein
MKNIPDYLTDRTASYTLAKKIQNFWNKQGYMGVRAWVEKNEHPKPHFVVKTNIKFKAYA